MASTLAVFILFLINTKTTKDIAETLEWIFYVLFPNFCFSYGMQELYNNYQAKEVSECMTSSAFRSSTISTPPNR